MILGKEEILNEIKRGNLKIEPFNANNIKGSSIDLTLDNKFRIFYRDIEGDDYRKYSRLTNKNEITLEPGDFILGITKEKITLKNLCGWLQGRSTYARIGLGIHVTANFIHPGVSNKQVLEIKNLIPTTCENVTADVFEKVKIGARDAKDLLKESREALHQSVKEIRALKDKDDDEDSNNDNDD